MCLSCTGDATFGIDTFAFKESPRNFGRFPLSTSGSQTRSGGSKFPTFVVVVCPTCINRAVLDWPPILEMHDSLSFVFLKAKNVSNILA